MELDIPKADADQIIEHVKRCSYVEEFEYIFSLEYRIGNASNDKRHISRVLQACIDKRNELDEEYVDEHRVEYPTYFALERADDAAAKFIDSLVVENLDLDYFIEYYQVFAKTQMTGIVKRALRKIRAIVPPAIYTLTLELMLYM